MSGKGTLLVAAAVLTVLLAVWVTAASPVHLADRSPAAASERIFSPAELPERSTPDLSELPPTNSTVDAILTVLLALMILPLVVFVLLARRTRRRTAQGRADERRRRADRFDIPDPLDGVPAVLSATAQDQIAALTEGDPRNAIVACWLQLEQAATSAGLRRNAAETSTEFTTRVLGFHALDRDTISDLAELYREARFSTHELGESHRRAAIAAVTRLHTELSRTGRNLAGRGAP